MSRGWLLSSIALGLALGALFAAYPYGILQVADWFFDHERAKFPLAVNYQWNLIRRVTNWVPFLLLLPALFAVFRKLVFPNAPGLTSIPAQGELGQAAAEQRSARSGKAQRRSAGAANRALLRGPA